MKVLLINGSPRKSGNTFLALREIANTLQAEGIESEIVWIGNKPLRGCIACGMCKRNNDGKCVFDDDVCNKISAKFAEADGFVFGSPVYYGQPNGALLAIMQRAFFSNGMNVVNKPGAAVTICRRGGATAAFEALQMPMQMMHMPIVTSQYWNIAYGREAGQVTEDTEGMQTMRALARNMAFMLRAIEAEKAKNGLPVREEWQPMHFIR
ncbi:MAG: flavodoxin family protein [Paludibacteraceae bacterium]|nr:flavodoxin family protein [Paludibacteraceae bacterium]